jgi:hypothetical protein
MWRPSSMLVIPGAPVTNDAEPEMAPVQSRGRQAHGMPDDSTSPARMLCCLLGRVVVPSADRSSSCPVAGLTESPNAGRASGCASRRAAVWAVWAGCLAARACRARRSPGSRW